MLYEVITGEKYESIARNRHIIRIIEDSLALGGGFFVFALYRRTLLNRLDNRVFPHQYIIGVIVFHDPDARVWLDVDEGKRRVTDSSFLADGQGSYNFV